jgi:hypothetical protein
MMPVRISLTKRESVTYGNMQRLMQLWNGPDPRTLVNETISDPVGDEGAV